MLLFSIFTVTLVALASTATFLFNSAPDSLRIVTLFYASVLLSVFGLVFFAAFLINWLRFRETPPWSVIIMGMRYGIVVALCLVLLLFLSAQHLLNHPVAVTILVIAVIAELLWRKRRQNKLAK